jgi:hypothetical protein
MNYDVIRERRRINRINEQINNKEASELNFPNSACSHMLIVLFHFWLTVKIWKEIRSAQDTSRIDFRSDGLVFIKVNLKVMQQVIILLL